MLSRVASAKRLLKSIVVVGASLTSGCGGTANSRTGQADPSNDRGFGGSAVSGAAGAAATETDAGPTPTFPDLDSGDCGASQRRRCQCTYFDGSTRPCLPDTQGVEAIECGCVRDAPLVPTDCPSTGEFTCLDWEGAGTSCSCNATAPERADQCSEGTFFTCHSLEPPVGCECSGTR